MQSPVKTVHYKLRCLLVAGLLTLPAGKLVAGVPIDRIIAVVEDDIVMVSELEAQLRTVRAQMRQQGIQIPSYQVLEKQVLERMIMIKLQLQLAARTGIRVDDETLNRTINNIAAGNNVNLSEFIKILEADGFSYNQFRENIREEIIISRLRQRQVDSRILVTNKEIENELANQEFQNDETEYRLGHILISVPEAATPEKIAQVKQIAEGVLKDLSDGEDFTSLATVVSHGRKALEGGDLGWLKRSEIPLRFVNTVTRMEKGEISDLIQSSSGFHIVKLVDLRSGERYLVSQTRVRHILLRLDELTADQEAEAKLQQIRKRIDLGEDFAKLAQSYSHDTISAAEGGDLGWVNPGQLTPAFEKVMNQLEKGQLGEPFKTQYGWHLIQVLDHREHDDTENTKRTKAAEAIRKRKSEESYQNWLRHLRDEAYVEYRLDEEDS